LSQSVILKTHISGVYPFYVYSVFLPINRINVYLQRLIFNIKNVNYLMSVADVSLPCHHLDVVNNSTM